MLLLEPLLGASGEQAHGLVAARASILAQAHREQRILDGQQVGARIEAFVVVLVVLVVVVVAASGRRRRRRVATMRAAAAADRNVRSALSTAANRSNAKSEIVETATAASLVGVGLLVVALGCFVGATACQLVRDALELEPRSTLTQLLGPYAASVQRSQVVARRGRQEALVLTAAVGGGGGGERRKSALSSVAQPRVSARLLDAHASLGVADQQATDKVLGVRADLVPASVRSDGRERPGALGHVFECAADAVVVVVVAAAAI